MDRLARLSALAVLSCVAACEIVLGMDRHQTLTASADASVGVDGGGEAGGQDAGPACVLPAAGDALVRIGDVLPSADRFDFCLRRSDGGPDALDAPVLSTAGCPPGLGYKDVLVPFSVPAGTYDVSAVAPGAGCGAPVVTAHGVTLASGVSVALYLFGTQPSDATLVAFPESRPDQLNTDLRFVHAVPGAPPFDFGVTDSATTPASILSLVFHGVAFGATSAAGTSQLGAIDANGYVQFALVGGSLNLGVAPSGTTAATLAQRVVTAAKGADTAFAIGKTGDVAFPEELYVCDERASDGIYTRCGGTPLDVTFDVFNAYLFGVFGPFTSLREPPIVAAASQLPGDFACFTDVYADADKAAIVAAAPGNGFPYSATFLGDTTDTPIDDPTSQDGGIPAPPSAAPCAGALASQLDDVLDCASASCATVPNDETSSITADAPVQCLSGQCATPIAVLAFGTGDAPTCWQCALMELYGSTPFGVARTECKTLAQRFYAFHGTSSPVLLSRHPLANVTQWVLPSTDWRVSVIRADVALDNGATIATYCTELTSPAAGATRPYTGGYGNGLTGIAAWQAEQVLQIQRLAAYVASTSGAAGQKAIVMGDFYTGPTVTGVLDPYNPDSFTALSAAFPIAAPPGYAPACTFCVDNPITTPPGTQPSGSSTWSSTVLLSHVPVTDVHAASLLLKDPVLDVESDAGSYLIPLSTYYAYQASVRVKAP